MTPPFAAATRFDEYQEIIGRVRQAVESTVPAGSTVLVASKGDPALLTFDGRTGWHFPRAMDGQYAGFHPADSNDAIGRLDLQRGLGARYLVIPATSAWWFDHYPELFAHVRENGRSVFENHEVGWIFELTPRSSPLPVLSAEGQGPTAPTMQVIELLTAILPSDATCALVTSKSSDLASSLPLAAFVFRYTDDPVLDTAAAIRDLDALTGAFLVVPAAARDWFEAHSELAAHVGKRFPLVTDQRNVCLIYDLRPQGAHE
jgi:hypothetical protein